jgi:membrane-associated phospholipid phosphatase
MNLVFPSRALLSILFLSSSSVLAQQGTDSAPLMVGMSLFAAGYSFANEDNEGIKEFATATFINLTATHLLKQTIDKDRPMHQGSLSFPSGHVSMAATTASYMGHRYGAKWGVGMSILTVFVAMERIEHKEHDIYDVLGGAALGYLAGAAVTTPRQNFKISPSYSHTDKSYRVNFQYLL